MYIPKHFLETDLDALAELIEAHAFGTLITLADGRPFATHVPFLYERAGNALHAHVARANPQWQGLGATREVLAIFQGPHGYISPTWYVDPGVPTWNYAAVHAHGVLAIVEDPVEARAILDTLVQRFEGLRDAPWTFAMPARQRDALVAGIVPFRMRIRRLEAKFKLSQNRSADDRDRVIDALDREDHPDARATAAWMRLYAAPGSGGGEG